MQLWADPVLKTPRLCNKGSSDMWDLRVGWWLLRSNLIHLWNDHTVTLSCLLYPCSPVFPFDFSVCQRPCSTVVNRRNITIYRLIVIGFLLPVSVTTDLTEKSVNTFCSCIIVLPIWCQRSGHYRVIVHHVLESTVKVWASAVLTTAVPHDDTFTPD